NNQYTIGSQLGEKLFRYRPGRSCTEDAVIRSHLRPSKSAIGMLQLHVAQPQLAESVTSLVLQGFDTLHAEYLPHQLSQDSGLIPRTCAHLQNFFQFAPAGTEQDFRHTRHNIGLRQGLPIANWQGGIFVSAMR